MGTNSDLAELLTQIEAQRERIATARRLALGLVPSDRAAIDLRAYAEELEIELEKLDARAAVVRQAANQGAEELDPEQSIAALKPPSDPEPAT